MTPAEDELRDLARSYTAAWSSQDRVRVAAHYAPDASIVVNGGLPTEIKDVADSFMTAFPDLQVLMDDLVVKGETVEYHWTAVGTNTGTGGTGNRVRFSGFEEWTIGDDALIASSSGHYDVAEYERQLAEGV